MSSIELRLFLEERLKKNFKTECLNVIEKEDINGEIFLTLNEEDLKNIFIEATFGIRRYLTKLIEELSHPIPEYPVYLRKFDSPVSHTDKYHLGHCADVSVNSRGRITDPIRNFHLIEDTDAKAALELITSEAICFISACISDRRNGTIYFGITPNSDQRFRVGEIVGVSLTKMEVQAEIQEAIKGSFTDIQKDMVRDIVREARFVPVIGKEQNLFVIEVDVVPSSTLLQKDIVRTKERFLPDRFLKNHKGKESIVFRFSDEGFPKIISTEELCQYEQVLPRIIQERKEEELDIQNDSVVGENLCRKLLNRLFGGSVNFKDTRYFFLMTGPLDDHMTEEYLRSNLAFIPNLNPKVVFDFNDNGDNEGLLKNLEEHYKYMPQIMTSNDFNKNFTEKEDYQSCIASPEQEYKTAWIFCNGYKERSIPAINAYAWNKERSKAFQKALKCYMGLFEPTRIYIIVCLFSQNYLTMIEACNELLRKHPEQKWIVLAETEEIAKRWTDELQSRNIINTRDINENCIIGLPWAHVNSIIGKAGKSNMREMISIPFSTGEIINVDVFDHWSDISVVSANEIPLPKEERETMMETEQERFYRGNQVTWLNFAYGVHVLKRDIYESIMDITQKSLKGQVPYEKEIVNIVEVIHQPGAGGTTVAKHILWDLRKQFRCCVVERINNQTCEQLDELRIYDDKKPRPILILIDNQENFQQLKDSLMEMGMQKMQTEKESFKVYCTLLVCTRCDTVPSQLSSNQVSLRQELSKSEISWFELKYKTLLLNKEKNNTVNPEFLIAFNVLKENFNKKYISKIVSDFTTAIKNSEEIQLLKFVAFLNTFDPQFMAIPVSCFDYIFQDNPRSEDRKRLSNWEANLSDGIKVLLNVSLNQIHTGVEKLKVFHKVIASEILIKVKETCVQQDSEIMFELLASDIFRHNTLANNTVQRIIRNIFITRESNTQGQGRNKFSNFILTVGSNEGNQTVSSLLERFYCHNNHQHTAQLLARYYISTKEWDKAKHIVENVIKNNSSDSFLWHTYGEIFKRQLSEKPSSELNSIEVCEQVNLSKKSVDAFRKGQILSKSEKTTKDQNNLAPYFGELEATVMLLGNLSSSPLFKNKDLLHRYLVEQDYNPEELNFFSPTEKDFLKSLESCTNEAIRRLDDEVLHIKENADSTSFYQQYNRKLLIDLMASIDLFFGETESEIPDTWGARTCNDYRLRQARVLGGVSLNSLLRLRKEGKNDTKIKIFKLMGENVKSSERNFYDLRSMIEIVTVCLLDVKEIPDITYQGILEWSKEMLVLAEEKRTSRPHLEMYLYYVLYNFPTQERCSSNLITEGELLNAIKNWKKASRINYPNIHRNASTRDTPLFFLGNGKPLHDIIFLDKTEALKMYSRFNEQPQEDLRVFTGILTLGGKKVLLQIKTKENSNCEVKIPTAYPVYNKTMYNRRITFYIGFSFTGLKAFGMCLENR